MRAILEAAHARVAKALTPGAFAIDATAGNGYDTVVLARLVGPAGRVFAFDIQEDALRATAARLEAAGLRDRVTLLRAGHETLAAALPGEARGQVRAAMFNLGYLPGGDKALVTRPETTCVALSAAWDALAPGGVLTIVVYPGHPGGAEEANAVDQWANTLPADVAHVAREGYDGANPAAPRLLAVSRAVGPSDAQTPHTW